MGSAGGVPAPGPAAPVTHPRDGPAEALTLRQALPSTATAGFPAASLL